MLKFGSDMNVEKNLGMTDLWILYLGILLLQKKKKALNYYLSFVSKSYFKQKNPNDKKKKNQVRSPRGLPIRLASVLNSEFNQHQVQYVSPLAAQTLQKGSRNALTVILWRWAQGLFISGPSSRTWREPKPEAD